MHCSSLRKRALMPHSARSVELIEPPRQPYARQAGRPDVGVDLFAAFLAAAAAGGSPASTAPPGTSRPSS